MLLNPSAATGRRELTAYWLNAVARRHQGQSLVQAQKQLTSVQPAVRDATLPSPRAANSHLAIPWRLEPTSSLTLGARQTFGRPLWIFLALVSLILIIACVNLANLLLVRTTKRQSEFALRVSLGASFVRLLRLLALESAVLTLAAVVIGWLLRRPLAQMIILEMSTDAAPLWLGLDADWRTFGFVCVIGFVVVFLFAALPARKIRYVAPIEVLRAAPGQSSSRTPVGSVLTASQFALTFVILFAAVVFARTQRTLAGEPLGFDPVRVMLATTDVRRVAESVPLQTDLINRAASEIAKAPGIEAVAATTAVPFGTVSQSAPIEVLGNALPTRVDRVDIS